MTHMETTSPTIEALNKAQTEVDLILIINDFEERGDFETADNLRKIAKKHGFDLDINEDENV